ncbi:MAG TPA: YciI family protein [Eudoraea sp.]|nr:YciI family protein [Eudoraea sp.]
MKKFMLIVREDLEKIGKMSDEERFASSPNMVEWVDRLIESGNYITGTPLLIEGRYVSKDYVQSDGPFIESNEGISGFDLIWAENLEQATAIAQSCPMVLIGMAVREVRPIINMPT